MYSIKIKPAHELITFFPLIFNVSETEKSRTEKSFSQKANDRLLFLFLFSTFTAILINNFIIHKLKKKNMKHLTLFFAFGALLFLSCQTVSARGVKIPFGDREVLNKVADLPDTEEYKTDNGNYIDLGTIHQEFNIAYILPLYIEQEPRLVGYCEKEDTYYELTEEQLSAILKENNLDGEKLNKVGFYSRYGGKIVGLIIIALIIWGFIPSKKKKTEPVEV